MRRRRYQTWGRIAILGRCLAAGLILGLASAAFSQAQPSAVEAAPASESSTETGTAATTAGAALDPKVQAPACADAGETAFLRGLNQDRQYSLAAYQAEIDRRRPGCAPTAELDLELAKALYQLGEFARVRAILRPRLGASEAANRRYWAEAHLLDFAHPELRDSLLAVTDDSGASAASPPAPIPEADARAMRAAALFLKGDAGGALSAWPTGAENPVCPDRGEPSCYLRDGYLGPGFAAALSLAPGAGYAYAGQTGDGIFAFTVVSLFYGIAAYYANYESPARAWTFAGFGAVFHASNMVGAHRAAKAANQRRKTGFLIALHRKWFP
jgi:hypothetical protein